jgi:hypothetical protein
MRIQNGVITVMTTICIFTTTITFNFAHTAFSCMKKMVKNFTSNPERTYEPYALAGHFLEKLTDIMMNNESEHQL